MSWFLDFRICIGINFSKFRFQIRGEINYYLAVIATNILLLWNTEQRYRFQLFIITFVLRFACATNKIVLSVDCLILVAEIASEGRVIFISNINCVLKPPTKFILDQMQVYSCYVACIQT